MRRYLAGSDQDDHPSFGEPVRHGLGFRPVYRKGCKRRGNHALILRDLASFTDSPLVQRPLMGNIHRGVDEQPCRIACCANVGKRAPNTRC